RRGGKDGVLHQGIQRSLVASGALVLGILGAIAPAAAQVRLEARYSATLAGIPIGSGTWGIDINDTQYTAAVSGVTTGLLRAFTGGQGNATARGTLGANRQLTSIYAATITSRKKIDSIRVTIANGNV